LADDRADAGSGCSANDGPFEASAEHRTENRATGAANQSTFSWTNATLIPAMIVMVISVAIVVVVVAAATAIAHSVVVGAIVVVLREGRHNAGSEEKGSDKDRFSKLGHSRLDASSFTQVEAIFSKSPQLRLNPFIMSNLILHFLCGRVIQNTKRAHDPNLTTSL
jgi:hypothetical protein